MSIEPHRIHVDGLAIDVIRKDIKNLHLGVYPPNGRIRVAAPLVVNDEAVRLAVVSRLGWIKRQRRRFDAQERQTLREYVSGESHYYLGRRYRLTVKDEGRAGIAPKGTSRLELTAPILSSREDREHLMQVWYRRQLRSMANELLAHRAPEMGIEPPSLGIKRMKTKWGTYSSRENRVWLNLELIKKPAQCIELIVVHELVHVLEHDHNDRFIALMDRHLPLWRSLRDELNRAPLAHEDWEY